MAECRLPMSVGGKLSQGVLLMARERQQGFDLPVLAETQGHGKRLHRITSRTVGLTHVDHVVEIGFKGRCVDRRHPVIRPLLKCDGFKARSLRNAVATRSGGERLEPARHRDKQRA